MNAIKEYENNKWKVIGQKVGKPAKVRSLGDPNALYCTNGTKADQFTHRLANNMPRSTSQV